MGRNSDNLHKYVRGNDETPVSSSARTVTGNSGWINAEEMTQLVLLANVTARSGTTPTLDILVEEAQDSSGTNNRTVGSFTQFTNTGTQRKSFAIADKYYRITWTIGGTTPSFTFDISGHSK